MAPSIAEPGEAQNLTLTLDPPGPAFDVRHFRVEASLSSPFRVTVTVVCSDPDVDLDSLLGANAVLEIRLPPWAASGAGATSWRGVLSQAAAVRVEPTGLSTYEIEISPELWLLNLRRGYRVFQRMSPIEMATSVLTRANIAFETRMSGAKYPKIDYRVQYDETDLSFFSRVLECAGVSYSFVHEGADMRLVIHDEPGTVDPIGAPIPYRDERGAAPMGAPWAASLTRGARMRPGVATLRTYDFTRPSRDVSSTQSSGPLRHEWYVYRPTAGVVVSEAAESTTPIADGKGAVRHEQAALDRSTKTRLEELRQGSKHISFETNVFDLLPGRAAIVTEHARSDFADRKLLVIGSATYGSSTGEWHHLVEAVFADEPYRPRRSAVAPRAPGVETAVVVGPAGEAIHTDEFGRVRVRFHWDRAGATGDDASCWVRVSQGWAGASYGLFTLPRAGTEVLVAFVGADPDQPVVVGRLHNAATPPPFDMPEEKTKTGLRTQSTPSGGFHELSFDDQAGAERMFVRAERDQEILVQHDRTTKVRNDDETVIGHDRSLLVEGEDRSQIARNRTTRLAADDVLEIGGSSVATIAGDQRLTLSGAREIAVSKDDTSDVQGDRERIVGGDSVLEVTGSASALVGTHEAEGAATLVVEGTANIQTSKTILLESDTEIVLAVGQSFIHVTAGEIVLSSAKVTLEAKDAQLKLDDGNAKIKTKNTLQGVSDDAIVFKAKSASMGLKQQAKIDGTKVLLNSPTEATDEISTSSPDLTEISLLDQDGNPLANQRFKITFSDGSMCIGFLDHEGKATIDRVGSGEITFPDLQVVENE